ncbi:hypothetical protein Pmani_022061 [Petrolisthes manimaculis]|uniref:C2H2-type domain-containing protein n=1 Tax=Petrolisthes manimaculis TaxID=1843537 RepID=A0AAE1PCT4_9EUCA|nr:hypothetical protein Pmani_022061 [Petrolisthes manimaculis]
MDASEAERILKTFPEVAYKLSSRPQFEEALSVHLVLEFKGKGKPHYRCCLCGSYAYEEAMFFHLIGIVHTNNYIVTLCKVPNNVVLHKHIAYYRNIIIKSEGSGIDQMKTILPGATSQTRQSTTSQSYKSPRMPKLVSLSGMRSYTRALVATVPPSLESQSLVARYSDHCITKIDSKGATALSEVEESPQGIDPELQKAIIEFVEPVDVIKKEGTLWWKMWKQKLEECQNPDEKLKLEANFKYLDKAMAFFQKKVMPMIFKEMKKNIK